MGAQPSSMVSSFSTSLNMMAVIMLGLVGHAAAGTPVAGWTVPSTWKNDPNGFQDYVVVKTPKGNKASPYGGYIFPGPKPSGTSSSHPKAFSSADGYYCEAKNYDANFGIWETQECANIWNELVTTGTSTGDLQQCKTVATRPCGCQQVCRPVDCTQSQIAAAITVPRGAHACEFEHQCRLQEERGFVTSCATQATFQISMWFGIIFTVIIAFAAYSMMNMSLDMDSLLYTVGEPDKKDN